MRTESCLRRRLTVIVLPVACVAVLCCSVICLAADDAKAKAKAKAKTRTVKERFSLLYKNFGRNSTTKVEVVSGPKDVKMRNGRVAGKQWIATSGKHRFKLTIEDSTGFKLGQLVELLQKLPGPYMRACEAVSDETEDGIAIYADLGGARAHGGKGYINLVPRADAPVIAHEAGHTLEQVFRESHPKILDKWEEAIKADRISISDYGDHVRHEDLAEFAQVYAVCLGAGPKHLAALKKLSPARFALWEKILKPSGTEVLRKALDPFYKKYVVADSLLIVSSEKVSFATIKPRPVVAPARVAVVSGGAGRDHRSRLCGGWLTCFSGRAKLHSGTCRRGCEC